MLRRMLTLLALTAFLVPLVPPRAPAQVPNFSWTETFSSTGFGVMHPMNGQSTCSIVTSGTYTGLGLVPQVSADSGATWVTASTISSGLITSNGTNTGNIAGTAFTEIRVDISTLSTGSVTVVGSCSSALALGSGGGGGGQTFPTSSPGGAQLVVPANASAAPYTSALPFPVTCISGCSSTGAYTSPLPIASIGVSPPPTPLVLGAEYPICYYPAGATPNLTAGTGIVLQCGSNGAQNVNVIGTIPISVATTIPVNIASIPPITPATTFPVSVAGTVSVTQGTSPWVVTTPAPVATIFVVNTPGVLVENTTPPTVLPTATAGATPISAPPVLAQMSCIYPVGGTPNVTAGNSIVVQCNANGAVQVTGTLTVNTPAPIATVYVANTPGVAVQNTPNVIVFNTPGVTIQNTPAVAPVATVPPTISTALPLAVQTTLPVNAYTYYWNGTAWAPNGTFPTPIPWTTASPEPVNCVTGCAGGGGGTSITIVAPTATPGGAPLGAVLTEPVINTTPFPVTTPAPVATIFVVNTPGFICISGCAGGAVSTPVPIASAGVVPTAAPPVLAETACYYPPGATPILTGGNIILLQCNVNGQLQVTGNVTVNTPAPVATVFIANTPSVLVANTTAPTVMATATAGVAGASALLVNAQEQCVVPVGGTPNVTAGNVIAVQCTTGGDQLVSVVGTVTVNTPVPVATVFVGNTPGVTVQNTTAPTAVATASPGVAGAPALLTNAQIQCAVPAGATPNVTPGNVIAAQCNTNGNLLVSGTLTVNTPAPVATVFIANTPAVAPVATIAPQVVAATPSPLPIMTSLPVINQQLVQTAASTFLPPPSCLTTKPGFAVITSATDTQLVGGVSGKTIYICGVRALGNGVNTGYLEYSTSTTCASGFTQFEAVTNFTAGPGWQEPVSPIAFESFPIGDAACFHSTSTGEIDVTFWYAQL